MAPAREKSLTESFLRSRRTGRVSRLTLWKKRATRLISATSPSRMSPLARPRFFKDVPSDNSYYPTWSPDGNRILFTLRQNEVWDLGLINADGTGFRVVRKGDPNEVTRYSPVWARDGQSVFCQDMTNIYRLGLDGAVIAQWKIDKII